MPQVALSIRLSAELHAALLESAKLQGWSLQHLITYLCKHAKPMTPTYIDRHSAAVIEYEWERARRIQEAKNAAAEIIAAARKKEQPRIPLDTMMRKQVQQ